MNTSETPENERPYHLSKLRSTSSMVIVNTGDGKGKSTAAFGTLLRAVACGWSTAVVQFLKSDGWKTGEERICRRLGVDWFSAGDGFTWDSLDIDETRAKAVAAWSLSKKLITEGMHQLIVLDEISYAITWGWIDATTVVETLKSRPADVSVILTGRDMASKITDAADTATEMVKIKHIFDTGVRAKKGIEY